MTRWMQPSGRHVDDPPRHASDAPLRFEDFYETQRDRLFRSLCLVTRDRHQAEELTQDSFVRVFERWDRISEMDDPVGYLFRTAMNGFRQARRRAATASRHLIGVGGRTDELDAVDDRDATVRALGTLSRRQRAVVVLIDMLDFATEDVARMLGLRASTVRVHLARARAALHAELGVADG